MAFRWLARRLLDSFRSPMMCSIARRCSSRWRRRRSSVSTCARSSLAAAPDSGTVDWRSSVTLSGIAMRPSALSASRPLPHALQLLLESDHLQLAADDHFLEFFEVQNLLLQLALGLFQVAHHLFVRAHVAQDTDGADHLAVGVAQGGGVEGGGDDLSAGTPGVEPGIAGDAALDHLAEGGGELPGLLGADEPRERLLEHLVLAEAEELGDGVVGLEDLALEVGDEDRVRGVGADDVGIQRPAPFGAPAVTLYHVRMLNVLRPTSI